MEVLKAPVVQNPLTGFLAYWHACTGTPYEEHVEYVEIKWDRDCPKSAIYWIDADGPITLTR